MGKWELTLDVVSQSERRPFLLMLKGIMRVNGALALG